MSLTATSDKTDTDFESVWQAHTPGIAWVTILLGMAIFMGITMTLIGASSGYISYPLGTGLMAWLMYASFTVMHDAGHGGIIKSESALKPIESLLGWAASLPLLIAPYGLFKRIHDRHHAFTNDPERDPDQFVLSGTVAGVLLNCLYVPFHYYVLAFTQLKNINVIRQTYRSSFIYLFVTIGSLVLLVFNGYWLEVLCLAIVPNLVAVFMLAMFFDYIPHHPHKSRDRFRDTRIYPGKLLNLVLLGQNYHLIHHMYPRLPWYQYRKVFELIKPYLKTNGATIEEIGNMNGIGFMKGPPNNTLLSGGRRINMVLDVLKIKPLTNDSVLVEFQLPPGEKFIFEAGQYITVSKWLANEYHTRSYSICSSPTQNRLQIAVRKTRNGLMSNYINTQLKRGDQLVVQGPYGDFTWSPQAPGRKKKLVLIAGGSGITPMISMIKTVLAGKENVDINLIYANRNHASVMFYDELQRLQAEAAGSLNIHFIFSEAKENTFGISGRFNDKVLLKILPVLKTNKDKTEIDYCICGPEELRNVALQALKQHGVEDEHIRFERFTFDDNQPIGKLHNVDISLANGTKHSIEVASNQSILEVANKRRIQIPHACGVGTCGSCKFKVQKGDCILIADTNPGITSSEVSSGLTLACQCKPLGDMCISEV